MDTEEDDLKPGSPDTAVADVVNGDQGKETNEASAEEEAVDPPASDEAIAPDKEPVQLRENEINEADRIKVKGRTQDADEAAAEKDENSVADEPAKSEQSEKRPKSSEAHPAAPVRFEDTEDEDGSEDEDETGELHHGGRRLTHADEDNDDTQSDASSQESGDDDGNHSPTSAADREMRLKQRLTSFDKRQEKFNMMKATVKTFDVNMEVVIGKWKRLREDYIKLRANSVLASGEDGSLMITRRMTELGNMCSRTTNASYYLATLPKEVQGVIKKMTALHRDDFTEFRRRGWTPYDRFLYAARMARVLAQSCVVRRRLTIEALANGRTFSEKDLVTRSMSKNLRDSMTYCPDYRTKEMRQKILWFLRTNKVYSHLFSSEMEDECTKFVFYEKYQDGRILSLCDRLPEKFYYVISGKIERRKTYELRAGDYDRVFSVITKGHTSDPEHMEVQKPMKFNLVASGITEVLTLVREDFMQLLKGTGGLPLKFLQSIGIFQEFPCDRFLSSPEAILTRYFPKDRIILDDITDTQWIHVVKSGTARVIRKQMVFHYSKNKYTKSRAIGYAKPPSHSQAMLGLTDRQRHYKSETVDGEHLPLLLRSGANPLSHTIGVPKHHHRDTDDLSDDSEEQQAAPLRLPKIAPALLISVPSGGPNQLFVSTAGMEGTSMTSMDGKMLRSLAPSGGPNQLVVSTAGMEGTSMTSMDGKMLRSLAPSGEANQLAVSTAGIEGTSMVSMEAKSRRHRPLNMIARELQIPLRSAGSIRGVGARPPSRQRETAAATARVLLGPDGIPRDRPQREAYVVLDVLRSGDFIGFRNITAMIEGERIPRDKENVHCLLSDGAEVILISKRFFVQNAANNTMLKAETMRREFASKEEASQSIDARNDWQMFKSAFIQRMVQQNNGDKKERQSRLA